MKKNHSPNTTSGASPADVIEAAARARSAEWAKETRTTWAWEDLDERDQEMCREWVRPILEAAGLLADPADQAKLIGLEPQDTYERLEQAKERMRRAEVEAAELRQRIARVRALHWHKGTRCAFCEVPWPCDTVRALDPDGGA